ncbi:hypothetical protein CVT24_010452 [Panaeolus cyanescens]|uniref:Uncharacterized protein n=1 Tax=Panaeolus cyanescens TaxID=181874 RepID=A0A409X468_9AGAR|nr:hypothetical protein CVT24_010452 [Panaeolus cyanescens]
MSTAVSLPIRGTSKAPRFTHAQSREISRYFEDVEHLVSQERLTSDRDKIDAVVYYADFDISDLWQSLPQFSAQPANYAAFKSSVLSLYPHVDYHENKFTISSLNDLIFRTRQSGIHSLEDLGHYYRQFIHISNFLIAKSRLSNIDSQRRFLTGFQDDLLVKILSRLQIQFLDHDPDSPWPIEAIYNAACFIIRSSRASSLCSSSIPHSASSPFSFVPSIPTLTDSSSSSTPVPLHDLSELISTLTQEIKKAFVEIFQQQRHQTPSTPQQPRLCSFCNADDHLIRNCALVIEYIRDGKAKRNNIGKVVLPSGRYVASSIPGVCLKEKFDEFHRLHPIPPPIPSFYHSTSPTIHPSSPSHSFYLSTQSRIEAIEAELAALRSRQNHLNSLSLSSPTSISSSPQLTVSLPPSHSSNSASFTFIITPTSSFSQPTSPTIEPSATSGPIKQEFDLKTPNHAPDVVSSPSFKSPSNSLLPFSALAHTLHSSSSSSSPLSSKALTRSTVTLSNLVPTFIRHRLPSSHIVQTTPATRKSTLSEGNIITTRSGLRRRSAQRS